MLLGVVIAAGVTFAVAAALLGFGRLEPKEDPTSVDGDAAVDPPMPTPSPAPSRNRPASASPPAPSPSSTPTHVRKGPFLCEKR